MDHSMSIFNITQIKINLVVKLFYFIWAIQNQIWRVYLLAIIHREPGCRQQIPLCCYTVFIIINLAYKYIYCRGSGSVFSLPYFTLEQSISVTIATNLGPLHACAAVHAWVLREIFENIPFCATEKWKHQNRTIIREARSDDVWHPRVAKIHPKLPAGPAVNPYYIRR